MKRRSSVARTAAPIGALVALLPLASSCGSTPTAPPADPAIVAAEEQRLLAPFDAERTIVAAELSIEMTANFYDELTRPAAIPGMQEEQRTEREDGGSEVVYRNRAQAPLRFLLGGTDFRVLRVARIVVLGGRSELTLKVDAEGGVNLLENGERSDFEAVRFAGGRMVPGT